jgi:hypothetical protein
MEQSRQTVPSSRSTHQTSNFPGNKRQHTLARPSRRPAPDGFGASCPLHSPLLVRATHATSPHFARTSLSTLRHLCHLVANFCTRIFPPCIPTFTLVRVLLACPLSIVRCPTCTQLVAPMRTVRASTTPHPSLVRCQSDANNTVPLALTSHYTAPISAYTASSF